METLLIASNVTSHNSCRTCLTHLNVQMKKVAASVRCIRWRSADVMLIGCLDGRVHQWQVGGVTKELLHLEGSVLHMQFDHRLEVCLHFQEKFEY